MLEGHDLNILLTRQLMSSPLIVRDLIEINGRSVSVETYQIRLGRIDGRILWLRAAEGGSDTGQRLDGLKRMRKVDQESSPESGML